MADQHLHALEAKLDELLAHCARLQHDNAALKARENDWQRERIRLIEKNELARSRVEAMITRLKTLTTE